MITQANEKQLAIISNGSVIFDALRDNSKYSIQILKPNSDDINSINKIDLLIIDADINSNKVPLYRINTLINLTGSMVSPGEIILHKPLKLEKLLEIISLHLQEEYLFCCLNKDWLYHQRLASVRSIDTEILLTDKENELFLALLNSKDFTSDKEWLKNKIWNYHQGTESATVETHLYNLKQKLPQDLLEIKSNQCSLRINSLE